MSGHQLTEFIDARNQLRALRWALGKDFRAMTMREFSDLADISYGALLSIAAGRRLLNDDDRLNIEILLGAVWSVERTEWLTSWDRDLVYNRAQYDYYLGKLLFNREAIKKDLDNFCKVIRETVEDLEPKKAHLLLLRQHRQLRPHEKEIQEPSEGFFR